MLLCEEFMRFIFSTLWTHIINILTLCVSADCFADENVPENWNAKFQSTYVWQDKLPFSASYSGTNSLSTQEAYSYSLTATAFLGFRPWQDGEIYINPEVSQGVPLSNLTGLGGFTNGEMARSSGSQITFYRARLFLRQSWNLGGEKTLIESAANQLAGTINSRRIMLTVGNISVADIFDENIFSHDSRTQFLNWSLMSQGAYDFAADARGYTRGIALENAYDNWVVRAGRFIQPKEPNQQLLDTNILEHYGDQIEFEHLHSIAEQSGKVCILFFRNRVPMSRYQDALRLSEQTGQVPDLNLVRNGVQTKSGFGINIEQNISIDIGVFARVGRADGKTEVYAFTEIDNSQSIGTLIKGLSWGRTEDTLGFAVVRNELSPLHRDYLAAGGMGFFIGDGKLKYRPENIGEVFYSAEIVKHFVVSGDWQYIQHPAYNADRGSVKVASLRLHTEF
jgi:high affinity Mn2+ porin